jgi:ATP-dependent RNA helicase DBP3
VILVFFCFFFLLIFLLGFSLPGLVHVSARIRKTNVNQPYMLVLSPTRELAVQTHVVCEEAGKVCNPPLKSVCIFGGVSKDPQKRALRDGAQIIVATPGRLMDLMNEGVVDLSQVSHLIPSSSFVLLLFRSLGVLCGAG